MRNCRYLKQLVTLLTSILLCPYYCDTHFSWHGWLIGWSDVMRENGRMDRATAYYPQPVPHCICPGVCSTTNRLKLSVNITGKFLYAKHFVTDLYLCCPLVNAFPMCRFCRICRASFVWYDNIFWSLTEKFERHISELFDEVEHVHLKNVLHPMKS